MYHWLADPPFFGGPGQGSRQIVELFVAFGLTAAGMRLGPLLGKAIGRRAELIGGLILIFIGVKILLDHLYQ